MEKVSISQRIKEGLEIKNLKQIDLSRMTGISRSMITEYIKGKYEPRQDNIYLIAKALDVSEAWLMGFDVKKERNKTLEKNIFVKNLNMMMIIDLRAFGDCLYETINISKERMNALLTGESEPTVDELKNLSKHLNIPSDALLSIDLSSNNGKYYLNMWAKEKKSYVLLDNEIILEAGGQREARKSIIYEFFFHLDNLNLNALIKLYDYITNMVLDENNLDEEKLGFQYILYEDEGYIPINKDAFEELKKETSDMKKSNEKIIKDLKSLLDNSLKKLK